MGSRSSNNSPFSRFREAVGVATFWLALDLLIVSSTDRTERSSSQPRPANVYTLRPRARQARRS